MLALIRMTLGWVSVAAALVAVFAVFGARPFRQWGPSADNAGQTMREGIDAWGGLGLLALVASLILLVAAVWPDRPRWWLMALPVPLFVWSAVAGYRDWRDLLDERDQHRPEFLVSGDYTLSVPMQYPVAIASLSLCALCLTVMVILWAVECRHSAPDRRGGPTYAGAL